MQLVNKKEMIMKNKISRFFEIDIFEEENLQKTYSIFVNITGVVIVCLFALLWWLG